MSWCLARACLLLMAWPSAGLAHRLDEYLQSTLVSIEPGSVRLHINLTPGVAVAQQVLAHIDKNRDGIISTNEGMAYAECFRQDLSVHLDQSKTELTLIETTFPAMPELRSGSGIIQLEYTIRAAALTTGLHKLTLRNRHLPKVSVYLLNAARPATERLQIVRQTRNKNQSRGEIEFVLR